MLPKEEHDGGHNMHKDGAGDTSKLLLALLTAVQGVREQLTKEKRLEDLPLQRGGSWIRPAQRAVGGSEQRARKAG